MTHTTTRDAHLVRGGSEDDVSRLLHCGGRIVRRGRTVQVRGEKESTASTVLQIPYVLIAFGESRRHILILLTARDEQGALPEPERSRPVAQQLPRAS